MRTIALIAHDNMKSEIVEWVRTYREELSHYKLCATGTTGQRVMDATGLEVTRYLSGPLGGDAQIGSLVATGEVHAVIFFVDPLTSMPHDPDIRMLLRICNVHNVPLATNRATADLLISSAHLIPEG